MEPITIWREDDGRLIERPDDGTGGVLPDGAWTKLRALPRADFDALVKERDDWRDTSMAAYAAAHGLDWQSLTKEELDAMEADAKAHGDKKAMDVVRRLYARWNAAVYDADKVRTERDRAEREWQAATARADKAVALLREARGCVAVNYGPNESSRLLARIDALLEGKGQTAPTPAHPTNHAPKATSADGCTEQKEP